MALRLGLWVLPGGLNAILIGTQVQTPLTLLSIECEQLMEQSVAFIWQVPLDSLIVRHDQHGNEIGWRFDTDFEQAVSNNFPTKEQLLALNATKMEQACQGRNVGTALPQLKVLPGFSLRQVAIEKTLKESIPVAILERFFHVHHPSSLVVSFYLLNLLGVEGELSSGIRIPSKNAPSRTRQTGSISERIQGKRFSVPKRTLVYLPRSSETT